MKRLTAAFVAAGLVLAACGGDDDDDASDVASSDTDAETDADSDDDVAESDDDATETTMADDGATETTMADDTDDDGDGDDGAGDDGDDDDDDDGDDGTTETTMVDGQGEDVCTEDLAGGELTLTSRGMSAALDPAISALSTTQQGSEGLPFYSVLMRYDVDTQEYVPHVADSMTPNDDYTEWTLVLRDGVTFGNGDPLDADAVVAHFERHLGEASTSRIKFTFPPIIQSWEKVDDMTVLITLNFGVARFPGYMAGDLGMVASPAVLEELGADFGLDPVGAGVGPYELVEYSPPENIIFEAKDDWWGGPVCIDRLTYINIPDVGANYDAYVTGEIDSVLIARDPVLIEQAQAENDTRSTMYNNAFVMMPNVAAEGPTSDPRVRLAMAYAIDPEVVNSRAWGGVGWPGKGIVNSESDTLSETEGIPYDPDMAAQILEEYKAETGWDGTLTGVAADTPASNQEAAIAVAAMLDAVGFQVETELKPINEMINQVIIERNFEVVLSWGQINTEYDLWSGLLNLGGQAGLQSEAYDAALAELRVADSPEAYQAALESVQAAVNQDVPFVSYGGDLSTMVFNPAVIGGIPFQNQTYLLDHAYLEQ